MSLYTVQVVVVMQVELTKWKKLMTAMDEALLRDCLLRPSSGSCVLSCLIVISSCFPNRWVNKNVVKDIKN